MHDPTEGGISTALRELARAARVGLEIESVAMHITDETRTLCKAFDLDPLGVISSGALLIGVAAEDAEKVKAAILAEGIRCDLIGRATREELGLKIREGAQWLDLPAFDRDEIGKAFE
jgi:hydrogenase maturation factor